MATINQADTKANGLDERLGNAGPDKTKGDRLIRLPELMFRTGLRRSTLYEKIKAGAFPRQKKLGLRIVAWSEAEVETWIADPR